MAVAARLSPSPHHRFLAVPQLGDNYDLREGLPIHWWMLMLALLKK
jgi:hypothetical protein